MKSEMSKNWGGVREGAGRPRKDPSERKVTVAITLTPADKEQLLSEAARRGLSVSGLVSGWLRQMQS